MAESTADGDAKAEESELWLLQVVLLSGRGHQFEAWPGMQGIQLKREVKRRLGSPGKLCHKEVVEDNRTLAEQGIRNNDTLVYCHRQFMMRKAWRLLQFPTRELAETADGDDSPLEGLTAITMAGSMATCLQLLPDSLQSLTIGQPMMRAPDLNLSRLVSLRSLTFGDDFDAPLRGLVVPPGVQSLAFGRRFDRPLAGLRLPTSLRSLTLGRHFSQELPDLPSGLEVLTLGDEFDRSLEGLVMPADLRHLAFGRYFNSPLPQLPGALVSLTFGLDFNLSLEEVALPQTLRHLTFGGRFNQTLRALPEGLYSLTLGAGFSKQCMVASLPPSLRELKLFCNLGLDLPESLQMLTFGAGRVSGVEPDGEKIPLGKVPVALRSLEVTCLSELPENLADLRDLESLAFADSFNEPLGDVALPENLKTLVFSKAFDQDISGIAFPKALRRLAFGAHFQQSMQDVKIPSTVEHLTMGGRFDESPFLIQWPMELKCLKLGDSFNQCLCEGDLRPFPEGLLELAMGKRFNQAVANAKLPRGLERPNLGDSFNQPLRHLRLESLRSLALGRSFDQPLKAEDLQGLKGLEILSIGPCFKQPLDEVRWKSLPCLHSLTVAAPLDSSKSNRVKWPSSLRKLHLSRNLPAGMVPEKLQQLTAGLAELTLPEGPIETGQLGGA